MLESLAKRLFFFGRLIVVVFLITLVAWLQKCDAKDFREDVRDLSLLWNLQSATLLEETRWPSRSVHDHALDWLDRNYPDTATPLRQVRQKVTDWLSELGTPESDLSRLAGKPGTVGRLDQEITPFYFIELVGAKESLETEDRQARLPTVAELLDTLDALTKPTSLTAIAQISEPLPSIKTNYHFKSAQLQGQSLEILTVEDVPLQSQLKRGEHTISLPVTISHVNNAPSLLYLSDPDRRINGELEALFNTDWRKARLGGLYGLLPIEEAKSIASKGLTDAYQSISIFGFSFSTRLFPYSVLVCMTMAILVTWITIGSANRESLPILTDFSDPDVMDLLMDYYVGRVILWAILPPLAIVASLPPVPIGVYQRSALIVATVVLAVAGLFCVLRSRTV